MLAFYSVSLEKNIITFQRCYRLLYFWGTDPFVNIKICEFPHDIPFSHKTKPKVHVNFYTPLQTHNDLYLSLSKYIFTISESVLQSVLICFLIEPTGEISYLTERSHCEPQNTTFQSIRDLCFVLFFG